MENYSQIGVATVNGATLLGTIPVCKYRRVASSVLVLYSRFKSSFYIQGLEIIDLQLLTRTFCEQKLWVSSSLFKSSIVFVIHHGKDDRYANPPNDKIHVAVFMMKINISADCHSLLYPHDAL